MTAQLPPINYPEALESAQRPLLFFHRHLRALRAAGESPADYHILMYRPPAPEHDQDGDQEGSRQGAWLPVPAAKYLKHRALEWREAERIEDLPPEYHERAAALDAALAADQPTGGAA